MKNKALRGTFIASFAIAIFSYIFLCFDVQKLLKSSELLSDIHLERDNWLSVFLSIFAILTSLYTALVANNLSVFSFQSLLTVCVRKSSFSVTEQSPILLRDEVLSVKKRRRQFFLCEDLYKLEFELENCFSPLLTYELENITLKIKDTTEIITGVICPEISTSNESTVTLLISSEKETNSVRILPSFADPELFPYSDFSKAKIDMIFKISMKKPNHTQYMQIVLFLNKEGKGYTIENSIVRLLTKREKKKVEKKKSVIHRVKNWFKYYIKLYLGDRHVQS